MSAVDWLLLRRSALPGVSVMAHIDGSCAALGRCSCRWTARIHADAYADRHGIWGGQLWCAAWMVALDSELHRARTLASIFRTQRIWLKSEIFTACGAIVRQLRGDRFQAYAVTAICTAVQETARMDDPEVPEWLSNPPCRGGAAWG